MRSRKRLAARWRQDSKTTNYRDTKPLITPTAHGWRSIASRIEIARSRMAALHPDPLENSSSKTRSTIASRSSSLFATCL